MKYIFKQIDDISGHNTETTVEFSADTLSTILEHFEMFIRGSGFHPSGTLDFVPDEEYYGQDYYEQDIEMYDSMDLPNGLNVNTKGQNAN